MFLMKFQIGQILNSGHPAHKLLLLLEEVLLKCCCAPYSGIVGDLVALRVLLSSTDLPLHRAVRAKAEFSQCLSLIRKCSKLELSE